MQLVVRWAHNPEAGGSSPSPATGTYGVLTKYRSMLCVFFVGETSKTCYNGRRKQERSFLMKEKGLKIVAIVLGVILIISLIVLAVLKFGSQNGYVGEVQTLNEVDETYLSSQDINGFTPMISLSDSEMKITISPSQYIIGTYTVNEDGMLTFDMEENRSSFDNNEVSNLLFEKTTTELIPLQTTGGVLQSGVAFEK